MKLKCLRRFYNHEFQSIIKVSSLIIFLSIVLSGCDIFDTREAEEPTQPKTNIQLPITTDLLLENFRNSISNKDVVNYLATFSDTSFTSKKFQFVPSNIAVSQYPSLAEGWNKRDEEQYFTNMITRINDNSQIILDLSNSTEEIRGDSTFYSASYSLNVPFTGTELPGIYQGNLTFKMVRDERNVWSIYYWQDIKSESDMPTWSELKGRLAN